MILKQGLILDDRYIKSGPAIEMFITINDMLIV